MGGRLIEGITPAQREALLQLSPAVDATTYLAGGVIAVELHHRLCLDLDLFVASDFDAGAAKDFWDLSELLHADVASGEITALLRLYERKFPVEDVGHAIKSLAYFGDADTTPLPRGLLPARWALIKEEFSRRVSAL